jgi:hypothetical protein
MIYQTSGAPRTSSRDQSNSSANCALCVCKIRFPIRIHRCSGFTGQRINDIMPISLYTKIGVTHARTSESIFYRRLKEPSFHGHFPLSPGDSPGQQLATTLPPPRPAPQRGEREIHPFVLIANHQLSEKRRPASPKILRSILTSRRVARVRNFTFGPTGFQGLPTHPTVRLGYISRPSPLVHPARSSVSAHLACVCARGRTN